MKVLTLNGKQNTSQIIIGNGILKQISELLSGIYTDQNGPSAILIITDSNVAEIYLQYLEDNLAELDIPVYHHIIPAGEEYKNLETIASIYNTLADSRFGRDDMIIALGGGVTGDMAGFASATYMRGIRHLMQIPTTLLSQVDSSVGGKTGVDLTQGKNMVGAFRQPDLVLIDPQVLDTLPDDVFRAGLAEVIKYGCIWDPEILDIVSGENITAGLEDLIERCVRIKIKIVEEDETEKGLRRILNFGHTIGHGIEKLGDFAKYSHGEAVSIGMASAIRLGESLGITKKGNYSKLKAILDSCGLPTELTYSVEDIYEVILLDKKKQGESLNFIFIEDIGKVLVKKIPVTELLIMMKVLGD